MYKHKEIRNDEGYICIIPCSVDPGCTRGVYVVMKKLNFCCGRSILIGRKVSSLIQVTFSLSFFLLFRQWKLEDLCYKSGEVVTETHHLNQVRHNQHSVYSFSVFDFLSLYCCYFGSVCQFYYLLNHLDHRKATSLPHHHTFGLLLGGG